MRENFSMESIDHQILPILPDCGQFPVCPLCLNNDHILCRDLIYFVNEINFKW